MPKYYKKFVNVVSSKSFFWVVLLFFIFEAVWISLFSKFPMIFDEAYHLSIIQAYSHQLSPFFRQQPPGPLTGGPLVHNSSFIYHYLMSFPYRLIVHFSANLKTQIILLRLINVALFAWAIYNFKRLLVKVRDEPAIANLTVLFFVLLPVVPFLAAQINYDNLGILFISFALLWTVRSVEQLRTKQQLNISLLIGAISMSLFASMVSYLFLPIVIGIAMYLIYVLGRFAAAKPNNFKRAIKYNWHRLKPFRKFIIILVLVVSVGVFLGTYGANTVRYHNPLPQCNQVLSVNRCVTYTPWLINTILAQNYKKTAVNPLTYSKNWVREMYDQSVSVINGPAYFNSYDTAVRLPVFSYAVVFSFIFGVLLFIRYARQVLRENPYIKFLLFISIIFVITIWAMGYYEFWRLGEMEAVSGRYLVPVMLPIVFTIGLCYKKLFAHHKKLLAGLSVLFFICLIEGGGIVNYIYASNSNWYWPNDHVVIQINKDAQDIIKPLIIN